MKRISFIFFILEFIVVPITIRAAALHYIPTQEQLQPQPPGIAPNISHNVNFQSPASPSLENGTGTVSGQPDASPSANTAGALGQTGAALPAGGLATGKFWAYGLVLFLVFFLLAFIFIRRQDDEK